MQLLLNLCFIHGQPWLASDFRNVLLGEDISGIAVRWQGDNPRRVSKRLFDCPQCGAPVPFPSSIAVFAVCEHCQSMVVLRDSGIERLGEMAALPPDLSPLRIGTRGVWKGVAFELIGRIRVEWEGGSWTEWWAEFSDHRSGWLAETQGFFAISFAQEPTRPLPDVAELQPAAMVLLANRTYEVVDIKSVVCLAGEGALPFAAPPGLTRQSVDLMASDGGFATLDYPLGDDPELFIGAYATFESLQFTDLRPVPGWDGEVTQTRHATHALNCPGCGAPVELRAAGLSMAAVCGSCGAVIDTANPHAQLIQQAEEKVQKMHPILAIGKRGQLFGTEYEVIGLLNRYDGYAKWSEYLLFNPWQGFRWLVTYRGHWSFIDRLLESPKSGYQQVMLPDRGVFKHFATADTRVVGVLGEFFWKVHRGEQTTLNDYVAPPWVLSSEKYPGLNEITWSLGYYVEPDKIAAAFGLPPQPEPGGKYLNEPNPHKERWKTLRRWALLFIFGAVVVQILFAMSSREWQVTEQAFAYQQPKPAAVSPAPAAPGSEAGEAARTLVIPEFELKGRTGPVTIALHAPVQNNWLGMDFALVNAATNQSYEGAVTAEYYSGFDGGESWSEGSQNATVRIPAVPPGRYILTLDPEADPAITSMPFEVKVRRGGLFLSNFFLVLAIIGFYPAWVFTRGVMFENARWAESDHAPSSSSDDD